jgi:hypothetical protein
MTVMFGWSIQSHHHKVSQYHLSAVMAVGSMLKTA